MADRLVSKTSEGNLVRVRLPPPAHFFHQLPPPPPPPPPPENPPPPKPDEKPELDRVGVTAVENV